MSDLAFTVPGRSAWTKRGFPYSGTMYRRNVWDGPSTGGEPDRDWDHRAVHYGVLAIQMLLQDNVGLDYSTGPGIFGPRTDQAARTYQSMYVPPTDGIVGPNTMKSLLRKPVLKAEMGFDIPGHLLWGLVGAESGYDPGAVGYSTPTDLGLVQINVAVQTVSEAQAFDPSFSITWAGNRMRTAHDQFVRDYRLTDERLAWDCAVANHNSPAWARQWASTGVVPNTTIAAYVSRVRTAASKW